MVGHRLAPKFFQPCRGTQDPPDIILQDIAEPLAAVLGIDHTLSPFIQAVVGFLQAVHGMVGQNLPGGVHGHDAVHQTLLLLPDNVVGIVHLLDGKMIPVNRPVEGNHRRGVGILHQADLVLAILLNGNADLHFSAPFSGRKDGVNGSKKRVSGKIVNH